MNTLQFDSITRPEACRRRVRFFATLALISLVVVPSIVAQESTNSAPAPEETVDLGKFVTTGSRFNDRTVTQSLVPIDVVSGEEVRNAASEETPQILQRLIPSVNFPRTSISDGTDSTRPATLRGLAPDQLLVLVNGKRQHQSALINVNGTIGRGSGMVDLNVIPTSIIGHIEVLRDGASAQYGSDAIAGVVNLVLREEIRNELQATWGQTNEGDGRLYNLSAYDGFKIGDSGKIAITAYYRDREGTDRSLLDTRQQYFGINPVTGGPTAISGNYGSGTGLSASSGTLDPREATIDRQTHRQGDSATKDKGLFLDGEWALGGSGPTFYVFGGYNTRDVTSYGFFRRAGQDTNVRAIYPDGYLPTFVNEVTDASFGGGFKGKAAGWDYDASLVWGKNDFDFNLRNTVNVSLGTTSPTRFYAGSLGLEQLSGNLDLDRNYEIGLPNPLKIAIGFEWRDENYTIEAGEPDSYRDGGVRILDGPAAGGIAGVGAQVFPGFRPSDATDASRHSYAVYLDMENQVTSAFTLSGAVRFEDYSDFGNTTTFKVAGRYDLPAGFGLRASASSGFRAPGLGQQFFTSTATNFITVGGVLTPVDIRTLPVNTVAAKALGATSLSPEKSRNYTAGITYNTPGGNFSASVDYYRIYIDDRIVLSSTFTDPAIPQFFENQGLTGIGGARFFTNAVDTRTEGVDFSTRYVWKLDGWGRVTFTGGYNINTTRIVGSRYGLNSDRTVTAANPLLATYTGTPLFDLTERVRMEKGQPDQTVQLGAQWNYKKFDLRVNTQRFGEVQVAQATAAGWDISRINYLVPGYAVQIAPAYGTVARGTGTVPGAFAPAVDSVGRANGQVIQTFEAKWIADFEIGYEVLDGLKVSIGMQNAFDTYPEDNIRSKVPVTGAVADGANNGQGADTVGILRYNPNGGAPWGINGRFSYVKATYRF